MTQTPAMDRFPDLDGLRRGRPEAIEGWFETYADSLYAFVFYRVGRDPELAADVVQETFLTALGKIRTYDPERGEMLPWLTFMARNATRKTLRQEARYESRELWERIDGRVVEGLRGLDVAPLPDDVLERKETAELVQLALSRLSSGYRQLLEQRYHHQRSVREIARSQGVTSGSVKTRLHRARLAFKTAFESVLQSLEPPHSLARASS
jgi:RNA polymerase sigma-70 factor (ECF subfamily)